MTLTTTTVDQTWTVAGPRVRLYLTIFLVPLKSWLLDLHNDSTIHVLLVTELSFAKYSLSKFWISKLLPQICGKQMVRLFWISKLLMKHVRCNALSIRISIIPNLTPTDTLIQGLVASDNGGRWPQWCFGVAAVEY